MNIPTGPDTVGLELDVLPSRAEMARYIRSSCVVVTAPPVSLRT